MKAFRIFALATLAMLLPAAAASAQEVVKVGVCNPAKVLEGMDERKVIVDRIKSEREKATAEVQKRRNEVEELGRQRAELKPESPIFAEKTNQLMEKAASLEVWARIKQAEMDRVEKEYIKALYDKIRDACKEVATEKKLDLILAERKPELPPNMEKLTAEQVGQIISANDVLYANEKADITQDIILKINKKYAQGGGVAPVGQNNTNTNNPLAPQR